MTASYQTKKGRPNYYIVLAWKDDATGKNKTKWISTDVPTKGDNIRRIKEKVKEVLAEYERQDVDLSKDVLFTVFIKEWLENLKPSIEAVTYDTYRLIIYNQIIPFYETKELRVKDVTPMHIQQYINFKLKTVSPNTVRKHLWNMSKCLDSAVRQNLIAFNPVKRIDLPKMVRYTGAKYYNEKQISSLLSAIKGDLLEDIVMLTLFYGLRRSEIMGLKWDAIDLVNKTIAIQHTVVQNANKIYHKDSTKNKSSYRIAPIPDIIKIRLKKIKARQSCDKLMQPNDYKDTGYVFAKTDGTLINPNYVTKHFKDILVKSDLPIIRFHDLRHSSASYLFYLGFNMKEIQMWLGHGDIGTTVNIL